MPWHFTSAPPANLDKPVELLNCETNRAHTEQEK